MIPELWQLWLPLIAVLAICGLLAWLTQRIKMSQQGLNPLLKLRASLALGTKERIAVVEVAGQWLVLGITPGRISTLHTLPAKTESDPIPEGSEPAEDHPSWLQKYRNVAK